MNGIRDRPRTVACRIDLLYGQLFAFILSESQTNWRSSHLMLFPLPFTAEKVLRSRRKLEHDKRNY
jgi:hypothetical protein